MVAVVRSTSTIPQTQSTLSILKTSLSDLAAPFGGAVFINSVSETNSVTIANCLFTGNQATGTSGNFGGSALYLSVKNGTINYCVFEKNKGPGGSIKVVNEYNDQSAKILASQESILSIIDCTFKINKDLSSSIFDVQSRNSPKFLISNCVFTGKIPQNAHHIDGVLIENIQQQLVIKDCKFFGGMKNAIDLKNGFNNIELNNKIFEYDENEKNGSKLLIIGVLATLAVLAIASVTCAAIWILKHREDGTNQEEIGTSEECL